MCLQEIQNLIDLQKKLRIQYTFCKKIVSCRHLININHVRRKYSSDDLLDFFHTHFVRFQISIL